MATWQNSSNWNRNDVSALRRFLGTVFLLTCCALLLLVMILSLALRQLWRFYGDTTSFLDNELLFRSRPIARLAYEGVGKEGFTLLLKGELVGGYVGGVALVWKASRRPSPNCIPEIREVALAHGLVASGTSIEEKTVFGREVETVSFRATDPEGRAIFGEAACEALDPRHSVLILWAVSDREEHQLLQRATTPRVYDLLFQLARTRRFLRS